jgi:hypothetical protein
MKCKICERETHPTGKVLHWKKTRTGNALLNKKVFRDKRHRFQAEFGRSGGEDIEFFKILMKDGFFFVWCDEAIVYETVPPERWAKRFYLRKWLRIGGLTGEKFRIASGGTLPVLKAAAALFLYLIALPFSFLFGEHIYMKCLIKFVYNVGVISGFIGHVIIRNRDD